MLAPVMKPAASAFARHEPAVQRPAHGEERKRAEPRGEGRRERRDEHGYGAHDAASAPLAPALGKWRRCGHGREIANAAQAVATSTGSTPRASTRGAPSTTLSAFVVAAAPKTSYAAIASSSAKRCVVNVVGSS